jgi:hypothetical protein
MHGLSVQVCRLQGFVLFSARDEVGEKASSELCGFGGEAASDQAASAEGLMTECVQKGESNEEGGASREEQGARSEGGARGKGGRRGGGREGEA